MLASDLVKQIEILIERNGDCWIVSTGYYGDQEVTDIEVVNINRYIPGITEKKMSSGEFEPSIEYDAAVFRNEKVFRLLPGSNP